MKRFIFSILCVSVFFVGLGSLVYTAGAKFKSDEKALALVRQARQAIGGDTAINGVQSLRIVGQTTRTVKINGADLTHQGETEIAMQLPDKLMKMIKISQGDEAAGGEKIVNKQVDVVVVETGANHEKVIVNDEGTGHGVGAGNGVRKIVIKKDDGTVEGLSGDQAEKVFIRKAEGDNKALTAEDGKKIVVDDIHDFMRKAGGHGAMKQNELLGLTLGLLLTAPQGMDVSYTYGGEGDVDGTSCNIVVAEFGGSSFKIYLGKSSNLPVMMSHSGHQMPNMVKFNKEIPADHAKDPAMLNKIHEAFKKIHGNGEKAEFSVKFSDYRSVGGVQLPYKWTKAIGGVADETFEVTSYEINPANIAEKFQNQKVLIRKANR